MTVSTTALDVTDFSCGMGLAGGDLAEAHCRMLRPREAANAQRFPGSYTICGNQDQQQLQAGNAVPVNVAHWIGDAVATVLDTDRAAARP